MGPAPVPLGLSHVAVRAADLVASCAFYCDALGFEEHFRLNDLRTGRLMLVCFKISDSQWLEVFDGPPDRVDVLHQVAFRVGDAEDVRRRLAAAGIPVPPATPTGQMGNRNFVVADPNGQDVEFVEHLSASVIERDRGRFLGPRRISSRLLEARLAIADRAQSQRFYGALGLRLGSLGDGALSLVNGDRVQFLPQARCRPQFVLAVDDLGAARADLVARRVVPADAPVDAEGIPALLVRAPEGTTVVLTKEAAPS